MPEPVPTVATDVLLLLHAPPAVPSVNVVVEPTQALELPVIGSIGFTRTDAVTKQLAPPVKVMVAVPPDTPDTTPDVDPTAAIAVLLLLQVPPLASLNVVVALAHTVVVPVTADGIALTVTIIVSVHPVPSV